MEIEVGNKLRFKNSESGCFIEVLHVGKYTFYGKDNEGFVETYMNNADWQHYEEEVTKDLEGVFKFYEVMNMSGRITVSIKHGDKESFNHNKDFDSDSIETITEKEAIERGLNV